MHSALLALPPLAMLLPHGVLPHGTARVPTRVPLARMITDPNSDIMSRLAELEEMNAGPRQVPERGNNGVGGRDRQKVNVLGAKLDADVAGALVGEVVATEEHERLFQTGVQAMRRGEYKIATTAFTQAVAATPGGLTTRKGGEYSVWLSQALHASRREIDAMKLLRKIESHPDKDVRTLGSQVLNIFQAPELKLGEENFMRIELDNVDNWNRQPRRQKEDKDPPPEKYSIEWYLERAQETERKNSSPAPDRSGSSVAALAVLMVATGAVVAFL